MSAGDKEEEFVFSKAFDSPKICLLLGICKSGKSYLTKYLTQYFTKNKKFKYGLYISGSGFSDDVDWIDERYMWEGYDEDRLKQYMDKAKTRKKMPNFLILDDCVGLISRSPYFAHLTSTHRHYGTSIFICSQDMKATVSTPMIRNIANYTFIFNVTSKPVKKEIYDHWGSACYEDYEKFDKMFSKATSKRFHCAFFNNEIYDKDRKMVQFVAPPNFKTAKLMFGKKPDKVKELHKEAFKKK